MMNSPAWFGQLQKTLRFWLQTCTAISLCLWIGYELSLTLASSAAITVCILADPDSGAVFSKSKWRFLGTLAGGSVVALLALGCSQAPWLFLVGLAVWTGICSYISAHFRYFKAYAAALSGYTATIILVEIHQQFDLTLFSTVQRVAEICLGILSVALVFGLTHIRGGVKRLEPQMHDQAHRTLELAQSILQTPTRHHMVEQLRLWVQQTEQLQHSLLLLGEEESVFARQSRSIRIALLDLHGPLTYFCDSLLALAQCTKTPAALAAQQQVVHCLASLNKSNTNNAQNVVDALQNDLPHLSHLVHQLAQEIQHPDLQARVHLLPEALQGLLQALLIYRQTRHQPLINPSRKFGRLVENPIAIYQSIGVAIGYLCFCAFWFYSEWQYGQVALLQFVAISMLQMSNDQPVQGLLAMMRGLFIAVIVVLPIKFLLLPASEGFGWLLFCTALGLLPGCALKTMPSQVSVGSGYLLFFTLLISYDNTPDYNIEIFLNQFLANLLSIVAAIALMAATHPWRAESRLRMLLRQARIDFVQTRQTLHNALAHAPDAASHQVLGQWEDRQFQRLLQLNHVVMLPGPRPTNAVARLLLRLTRKMRHAYDQSAASAHRTS